MAPLIVALALAAFPSYLPLRTPSVVDTMQYPWGSKVGIDTAADKWELDPSTYSQTNGMQIGQMVYGLHGLTASAVWGGFHFAAYKAAFGADQWTATQCVVPLDGSSGVYPAVRVNPATGDGYYLQNMGYSDGPVMVLRLYRVRALQTYPTLLATFAVPSADSNGGAVRGMHFTDGFIAMLEVRGTDPVEFRVSVMAPLGGDNADITTIPGGVPVDGGGIPYAEVVGTFSDSSPQRITSGRPGFYGEAPNSAGSAYNFNAGQYLSVAAAPVMSGSTSVTVYRPVGATVALAATGGAAVGSISWTGDVGTASVSGLPPGTTTITATSGAESASVVVTTAGGIPLKDRAGNSLTLKDRAGNAVSIRAR